MRRERSIELLEHAPVARMATVTDTGRVDMVPITFTFDGAELISAVDHKPKRTPDLKRLDNIRLHPEVTILVDHYTDDWDELWWVRLHGSARVLEEGALYERCVQKLVDKYDQYQRVRPAGAVIVLDVRSITGWSPELGEDE